MPDDPSQSPPDPRDVARALARLTALEREFIRLRWGDGLTYAQIAASRGISENAAKAGVARALARLRDLLRSRRRSKWLARLLRTRI